MQQKALLSPAILNPGKIFPPTQSGKNLTIKQRSGYIRFFLKICAISTCSETGVG
jgi:hypothetical protein